AERAREQQERGDSDQGDHEREVAVDGVDEVVVQGQVSTHADIGTGAMRGRAYAVERVARFRRRAVGGREGLDDRGAALPPFRRVGGDGAVDAFQTAQVLRDLVEVRAFGQHLVRQERPGADAGVLQRLEADLRVALLRNRVEVGLTELDVRGR